MSMGRWSTISLLHPKPESFFLPIHNAVTSPHHGMPDAFVRTCLCHVAFSADWSRHLRGDTHVCTGICSDCKRLPWNPIRQTACSLHASC